MQSGSRARRNLYFVLLVVTAVVLIAPIWMVSYPGMIDYPNHLTRCYILAHYAQRPDWQAEYQVVHDPLPNLALELIVVPLNHVLPLILSGKIFLTLAALIYLTGCVWVGYAVLGRAQWLAPLAALTFYNSALLWGFVNYCFGLGVFLCGFAFWMQSRHRMSWRRFLGCALFGLAAYISHLSAIVFLGVSCVTIALLEWPRHRSFGMLARQLAWLAAPLPVMLAFMKGTGQMGQITWPTLTTKVIQLFAPIQAYSIRFDAVIAAILLVCAVVIGRRARLHPVTIAAAVMFVLYLVTPKVLFTSSAADARYVLPAFLLLVLSVEPEWSALRAGALAAALLAMMVRTADIAKNWIVIDHRERQVLAMGDRMPDGARVYVVQPSLPYSEKLDRGFFHVVTYWDVSHRDFTSILFLNPGQQPLIARQPVCNEQGPKECVQDYDYVWTDDPPGAIEAFVSSVASPIARWQKVTLWRMNPGPRIGRTSPPLAGTGPVARTE